MNIGKDLNNYSVTYIKESALCIAWCDIVNLVCVFYGAEIYLLRLDNFSNRRELT
jgi:hypothetical protein